MAGWKPAPRGARPRREGTEQVSETNPPLPAWVTTRDGRVEPFDADRIAQALFAAGEALGTPNAFLARELTDAVLHFLRQDAGQSIPTAAYVAEQVAKVVRELGQPALAQAFAARHDGRAKEPVIAVRIP